MRNELKVVVLGLALGTGFAGCSKDGDNRTPGNTSSDNTTATAPATAALSNADLENVVKAKIQSDDQLRAADIKVNADADKKEITLSGTVVSQEQRKRALDLAKEAYAGLTVNDKIDVKPAA